MPIDHTRKPIEFAYETCIDCGSTDYHHAPGCEYEHTLTMPVCWDCRSAAPAVWSYTDNHSRCDPCHNAYIAKLLSTPTTPT
jgi:hypothetical protein